MLTHRPSGKTIPRGIKENVAFIVENQNSLVMLTTAELGLELDHYVLTEDNRLDYVDKKDGKYIKFVKGKHVLNF